MKNGKVEIIVGGMFSGKSEELIRRAKRAVFAKQNLIVFNHKSDERYAKNSVASHNRNTMEAVAVHSAEEILLKVAEVEEANNIKIEVVCIDEAQFFGDKIPEVCEELANNGKRVVVAGLDQDFRGEPFGNISEILARAEEITKLNAICACCGNLASRTQRLVGGKPAKYSDPIILVGASQSYEPRCRKCHIVER